MICVSGFLFPFLFLSPFSIVTSHYQKSFSGFSCLILILSRLEIILGQSKNSWSIAWKQRQLGLLPGNFLARCPCLLQL
jgi:hypothetical protein